MTWRETYWDDAAGEPAYFAAVEFATVLDGDYGTRMFGRWVKERYPDSHDLIRALEYLLVTNAHAEDLTQTMEVFHRRLQRPWDDPAMLTALERTAHRFPDVDVPQRVDDDEDVTALTNVLSADPDVFRLWREELQEAAVDHLREDQVIDTFLADCLQLAHDVRGHLAAQEVEQDNEQIYDDESSDDEEQVTVVPKEQGVRFAEPAERYPWLAYQFRLGVTFSLNPEANAHLPGTFTWDDAQVHLSGWGIDLDEFAEWMGLAMKNQPLKSYRSERVTIYVSRDSVDVQVNIDSGLNAHNTGIIATLDTEGAYTHYVQYKDLVMFYVDENDMNTPIYNVLKTFGDLWVGGDAESYVVRHGKGRKAHFTVTPVKASHQASLVAVVRRCSDGMTVRILD
jgi:hypothetical protein